MLCAFQIWIGLIFVWPTTAASITDYVNISDDVLCPKADDIIMPIELGVDKYSGCLCRASKSRKTVICYGNYECRRFPKVTMPSEILKISTTVIDEIIIGDLDNFYFLKVLDIEANHKLKHIEPGSFRNMSNLQHLSISYNTVLHSIQEDTFEGLINLRNLTLVNNGFKNVMHLAIACRPHILPSLEALDLSENPLEKIPEDAFLPMNGTSLKRLDINLCTLDFIHPRSFSPLNQLKELYIGDNDLNVTIIENFLIEVAYDNINLKFLDLSGLGFRRQPPRKLLDIIANTTVKRLNLAQNQFETIGDNTFPTMANIELLDLRRIQAITVGTNAFGPSKFPNLKILLLGGNNLPGIHQKHLSRQLLLLDLSNNKGNHINPVYFEIDKNTFEESSRLRVLNLAYNRIKSVFNYTFKGLDKLKLLNLENGTLFHIGNGTFKNTKELEVLNLGNNPLSSNGNLRSAQFEGLNNLKVIILKNCGIKKFNDDDNIFEMMPNLTHLILKNNQILYVTAETLKPLKFLKVLDLSENLLISWWSPLFLASGVKPLEILLTNNKISHFSISMLEDICFLLESNASTEINILNNVFVCDCNSMYSTYLWMEVNGTAALRKYFKSSNFHCSSPDLWEDRLVQEYLTSVKTLHCLVYTKISNIMLIVWTAPSLVTIALVIAIIIGVFKYRIYIRYWLFLAKIALGRRLMQRPSKVTSEETKGYKYDAFISYCFEDRDFVLEMITHLETYPPYLKLCVSERDFEIGSFISEAILKSINESKYVVLLISNNFAKSQWCRWETQLAEYHRLFLEDGTCYDPLVLIRLGDIDSKYLTPTLKYLLKTKIYLLWNENNAEDFWKKLRDVLGKK